MIHLPIGERFAEATSKQFFIISLYNLFIYYQNLSGHMVSLWTSV